MLQGGKKTCSAGSVSASDPRVDVDDDDGCWEKLFHRESEVQPASDQWALKRIYKTLGEVKVNHTSSRRVKVKY